jgi:DNA segregation ATPase FtsK/SpoIIIE, S-DNA-T family
VSRSSKSTKPAPAAPSLWRRHERDVWIVLLVVVGLFVALSEAHALGPVGRGLSRVLSSLLGVGRFALPVVVVGLGVGLGWGRIEVDRRRIEWGLALGLFGLCGLGYLAGGHPGLHATSEQLAHGGGWIGAIVGGGLLHALGIAGALIVLIALLLVATIVLTGVGLKALVSMGASLARFLGRKVFSAWRVRTSETPVSLGDAEPASARRASRAKQAAVIDTDVEEIEPVAAYDFASYEEDAHADDDEDVYGDDGAHVHEDVDVEPAPLARAHVHEAATPSHWELPPLGLLATSREQRTDPRVLDEAGADLVEALAAHGVDTTLVGYTMGPTVTRFELELGPGVKVARVTSLNRDIAYAMATPDVRIVAPIPGRSAIGVEVPNRQRTLVALGDLLATDEAGAATHPLDVPVGRDISGKVEIVNLGEMPHVLISGATGAGKSSCINSLITSLVMRATPDQVRLILIDPKRVEMGQYNDLPHLLAPVVVDPKKAAATLGWAVKEMERRYDILAECGARDITSYQQMLARGEIERPVSSHQMVADVLERTSGLVDEEDEEQPEVLPYIVIVVDELNDLMMVAARDVEESVVRIAQMARAVGIHLVLATQRPSVDVITGVIKANVPSRMAFAVSSLADSRVILDQAGAERLIGKGDMLLVTASSSVAHRLQSPWVSEEEVRRVVEFWRAQGGRRETVVALDERAEGGDVGPGGGGDDDEVLARARELVLRFQSGSTSMLQRKLRVGFARAGRLMDQLEEEGIVAAGEGSKARKVLMTYEEYFQERSV